MIHSSTVVPLRVGSSMESKYITSEFLHPVKEGGRDEGKLVLGQRCAEQRDAFPAGNYVRRPKTLRGIKYEE